MSHGWLLKEVTNTIAESPSYARKLGTELAWP